MSGFSYIRQGLADTEALERELNLKQLQINRLLNITQAINNNVSSSGLFEMYTSFLSWEMGVKKMALYFHQEEKWHCTASIGIDENLLAVDISDQLYRYIRLNNIEESDHPLVSLFDVVIPVRHKEVALAYVFIGGFGEDEDMYNKVQFITTITNIIAVAIENKRLFKQQIEQERMSKEMELATEMQLMLIPKSLPKQSQYEFSSVYRPHLNVGGDYYDYIEQEDKLVFCIGDIAGKGVAAALLMANFQANFHSLYNQCDNLKDFVCLLNESVLRITEGERFITFFVAEFDLKTRQLTYVNCGHNPPAMAMGGEIYRLKDGCTILGIFDELPTVDVGSIKMTDEALLVLYTDGLIDIQNEKEEYLDQSYGEEFVVANAHLPAETFNKKMMKEIEDFCNSNGFPDDFTVLTCKIF